MTNALCHRSYRACFRTRAQPERKSQRTNPARPNHTYFEEVDVNAPLYKPVVGQQGSDPTKRSTDRHTSDFIWNTNWQDKLEYQDQQAAAERGEPCELQPRASEGFLSLDRVASLNDMSVDLSQELRRPRPALQPRARSAAASIPMRAAPASSSKRYSDPPTPGEAKRWERSAGYVKRGAVARAYAEDARDAGAEDAAGAERARYEQLKAEYSVWTTATTVVVLAGVYALYTRDTAASYLIGALGGIVYLRLLHRSVDGVAAASAFAAAGSALGQPRLLIPVILVLVYNRYNLLYADSFGLHLELLPMLAGFFTYKAGVLGRASVALFSQLAGSEAREETDASLQQVEKDFDVGMLSK